MMRILLRRTVKATKSSRLLRVFPSAVYRSSLAEWRGSLTTIKGRLKKIPSHSM